MCTEEEDNTANEKMSSYEEAMQRIKDATGVTGTDEVVQRFEAQGETQEHLSLLQKENLEKLEKLREVCNLCCTLVAVLLQPALASLINTSQLTIMVAYQYLVSNLFLTYL